MGNGQHKSGKNNILIEYIHPNLVTYEHRILAVVYSHLFCVRFYRFPRPIASIEPTVENPSPTRTRNAIRLNKTIRNHGNVGWKIFQR
mmetsp:Transcript_17595/g.36966  ORF Transcript_17595/g.36966 Transcript_17595/m.36966 type:complete len:88 (+) Transcript_17595:12-275(+)